VRGRAARLAAALLVPAAATVVLAQQRRVDDPDRAALDHAAQQRNSLVGEFNAHLVEVQQRLKLEAAQQAAWDMYARRVLALMQDQMRGIARPPPDEDAPHQIDRRVDVVRNRLAAMEDIAEAAGHLYSLLSPEQRKVADELLPTTVPPLYSGLPDFSRGSAGAPTLRRKAP